MVPLPIAGVFGSFAYNVTMTTRSSGYGYLHSSSEATMGRSVGIILHE
jgi:hypothetical protein